MNRLALLLPLLLVAATGQRSGSQTITGATSSQRGTVRLTGDLGGTADNPSIVRANDAQVTATGTGVTKSAADWMRDGPVNGGLVTAAGSSTARSQADRAADVVNVRDFGAVGDGVTDDTAAIQAAVDSLTVTAWSGSAAGQYVKGGGTVRLPSGVYRITSPIRLGQHVRLVGQGTRGFFHPAQTQSITDLTRQKGTVLFADFADPNRWAIESATYWTASGLPLTYTETTTGTDIDSGLVTHAHGIEIRDLFIRSAATPVYGAIRLTSAPNAIVRGVGAYGFKIGFEVTGSWGWRIEDSWSITHWYGVLALRSVNAFSLNGYFNRIASPVADPAAIGELPNGIYNFYAGTGVADYSLTPTGIYLNYATTFDVTATSEGWGIGGQFINALGTVSWLHAERPTVVAAACIASKVQVLDLYNNAAAPVPWLSVGGSSTLTIGTLAGNGSAAFLALQGASEVYGFFPEAQVPGQIVAGGSGNAMARPAASAGVIPGEIRGARVDAPTADDGFLMLSAGGGTTASQKVSLAFSGFSTDADMDRTIVGRVGGTEKLRMDTGGLRASPFRYVRTALTYGASMTPNASAGNLFSINATNATAFTINDPTNPVVGQPLTITIKNTSAGALGAATWGAAYKMAAWTQPPPGFSRSITFMYDGVASWVEVSRTPADVPN